MNVLAPVSEIMTKDVITVSSEDDIAAVKAIFDENRIHHIPVVNEGHVVGIVSKSDFLSFMIGFTDDDNEKYFNFEKLKYFNVEDIMTKGLAKLEPKDRINVALEIFRINKFHAIPVVEDDLLVGILTTYDIIKALADEEITAEQIIETNKNAG